MPSVRLSLWPPIHDISILFVLTKCPIFSNVRSFIFMQLYRRVSFFYILAAYLTLLVDYLDVL